jgi:hypothetical protein
VSAGWETIAQATPAIYPDAKVMPKWVPIITYLKNYEFIDRVA